jgi:hypothetical protein
LPKSALARPLPTQQTARKWRLNFPYFNIQCSGELTSEFEANWFEAMGTMIAADDDFLFP